MAQDSNYTPVKVYRTETAAATPAPSNLGQGELAVNITDKKLYTKNSSEEIVELSGGNDHDHTASDITDFNASVDARIPLVDPKAHTHPTGEITGLDTAVEGIIATTQPAPHTHDSDDVTDIETTIATIVDSSNGASGTVSPYRYWRITVDSVNDTVCRFNEIALERGGVEHQGNASILIANAGTVGGSSSQLNDGVVNTFAVQLGTPVGATITYDFGADGAIALTGMRHSVDTSDYMTGFTVSGSHDDIAYDTICSHSDMEDPGLDVSSALYLFVDGIYPSASLTSAPSGGGAAGAGAIFRVPTDYANVQAAVTAIEADATISDAIIEIWADCPAGVGLLIGGFVGTIGTLAVPSDRRIMIRHENGLDLQGGDRYDIDFGGNNFRIVSNHEVFIAPKIRLKDCDHIITYDTSKLTWQSGSVTKTGAVTDYCKITVDDFSQLILDSHLEWVDSVRVNRGATLKCAGLGMAGIDRSYYFVNDGSDNVWLDGDFYTDNEDNLSALIITTNGGVTRMRADYVEHYADEYITGTYNGAKALFHIGSYDSWEGHDPTPVTANNSNAENIEISQYTYF